MIRFCASNEKVGGPQLLTRMGNSGFGIVLMTSATDMGGECRRGEIAKRAALPRYRCHQVLIEVARDSQWGCDKSLLEARIQLC